jgi:hypothetical protein
VQSGLNQASSGLENSPHDLVNVAKVAVYIVRYLCKLEAQMQNIEVICRVTLNAFKFMPIASIASAHQLFLQVQS